MIRFRLDKTMIAIVTSLVSLGSYAQVEEPSWSNIPGSASSAKALKAADRALQRNVRKALAKTKGLDIANVKVKARDGIVVLEGSVEEQGQSDLAAVVAAKVPGVKSVQNALSLRPIQ